MQSRSKVSGSVLCVACAIGVGTFFTAQANAMNMPPPLKIDGGPLGTLEVSGGLDGYFYALSGAGNTNSPGLLGTSKSSGAEVYSTQIKITKPTGPLRFTFELRPQNSLVLGTKPNSPYMQQFPLGPVYAAFATVAPNKHFSFSAGELYSVEGWEYSADFHNSNALLTDLWYVENTSSRGISASYSNGRFSTIVSFGDGFDTGIWNFLQGTASYTFNAENSLTLYGATNLGQTPPNATIAGYSGCPFGSCRVSDYGTYYVNSTLIGGYYDYTSGNLNLVPEVQYVYAKADHKIGLNKFSSNLGLAIFGNYKFNKTPWSLGGFVEYFRNNGPDNWFLSPHAAGWGLSVTPTWQHQNIFVRGDIGLLHLTSLGSGIGYGNSGNGRNQMIAVLETGLMF